MLPGNQERQEATVSFISMQRDFSGPLLPGCFALFHESLAVAMSSLNMKVETTSDTQGQDRSATTAFEFREYRIGAFLAVFIACFSKRDQIRGGLVSSHSSKFRSNGRW